MLLSRDDAAQYFRLMWGLQFYVNQQQRLLPAVSSCEVYAQLDSQQKAVVRDALWEHPEWIDRYLRANPDGRSEEELTLIGKWKGFISGKFYIFRYLKDYAIFMGNSQVYGVKGLYEPFEVVFSGRPLPVLVEAVLLPYKGQIVYDGLCRSYNLYFGGGIRRTLKEEYMAAKQNGRIHLSLEDDSLPIESDEKKRTLPAGSEQLVAELVHGSERLRGGTAIQSATFGVLRGSAKLVAAALSPTEDVEEVRRLGRQVYNALNRLEKILDRAEM
jgi:hypothetical protein